MGPVDAQSDDRLVQVQSPRGLRPAVADAEFRGNEVRFGRGPGPVKIAATDQIFASLRLVLNKSRMNFFDRAICRAGATEVGGIITDGQATIEGPDKFRSNGQPFPHVRIKIANVETGDQLGPEEVGEIRLKSQFFMNGYYKRPEDTRAFFDENGEERMWPG